ncbi:cupin domain-containing protein [Paraburkholderia sp. Tr-20389]|uniref:cupin domain-containing protein n=1 Tax=Paraburkholderia sp. Tr-20389 TaxID=2703903 RepID=UPI00197FAC66|nr:cupin domain-containing protein [Paraburkholderia sp. Tr-20389]MBN3757089.1 cupin domain-containing protein [Paraburkholderia sp. Tr-20389]
MNAAHLFASEHARHARTLATFATLALAPLAMLPARPALQWLDAMCSTPLLSVASSSGAAAQRPTSTSHTLSCEPLANVPGKSVTTVVVDFPPHAFTGAHRHPGSVTAYVISGTLRSRLNSGPAIDYRSGQTWFEPPGTLHDFVENTDPAQPAKLLAVFVTDSNCGPLVLPP